MVRLSKTRYSFGGIKFCQGLTKRRNVPVKFGYLQYWYSDVAIGMVLVK